MLVSAAETPTLMPSEGVLELHHLCSSYGNWSFAYHLITQRNSNYGQ